MFYSFPFSSSDTPTAGREGASSHTRGGRAPLPQWSPARYAGLQRQNPRWQKARTQLHRPGRGGFAAEYARTGCIRWGEATNEPQRAEIPVMFGSRVRSPHLSAGARKRNNRLLSASFPFLQPEFRSGTGARPPSGAVFRALAGNSGLASCFTSFLSPDTLGAGVLP